MTIAKVFLYAEIQASLSFRDINWRELNQSLLLAPGLKSKTWLSGINNSGIGGFYEFDSIENARAFAEGPLAAAAKRLGGSLSTKLFDGDVTVEANRALNSPFYAKDPIASDQYDTTSAAIDEAADYVKAAVDAAKKAALFGIAKADRAVKDALEKAKPHVGPAFDKVQQVTRDVLERAKQTTEEALDKSERALADAKPGENNRSPEKLARSIAIRRVVDFAPREELHGTISGEDVLSVSLAGASA